MNHKYALLDDPSIIVIVLVFEVGVWKSYGDTPNQSISWSWGISARPGTMPD